MKSSTSKLLALVALGLAGLGLLARAALPLANTPIGNQAKATYTDNSNVVREVFSNTVITRVLQVYALDLEQNNSRLGTPGSQVYFPHTVTNLGNGNDTISLSATNAGPVNLTNLNIYPDANQDGLPDNYTPITSTSSLAPGAGFHFVVVGIVPPSATAGQTGGVTVVANSSDIATTTSATDTNNDTFTVTNNAVMQVTKAIDTPAGIPGTTPVKYTITYTNTGNSAATNFTITDTIPAGMTYRAGSARWSVIPSTTLTDASNSDNQSGIIFDFGVTTAGRATYVVANVPAGESGFVTFEVSVNTGIAPQIIPNTAVYNFITGGSPTGPFNSNTVPFQVLQVAGVNLDGDTIANANAGDTIAFNNVLTNTGTGVDTFDITLGSSTYPVGTTFQLFQSDGATPMTDSNGNGVPDTGPVAAGATYNVVMKAVLPGNAVNGSGPFSVTKTARSTFNPAVTDTGDDVLTLINGASVDLTNNAAAGNPGALGAGANSGDNNATRIVTNNANPAATTTFTLVVKNTGPNPDSFNLLADDDGTFGSVNDLPVGWTVVFKNASGTVVSNTGVIAAGASATFNAEIFVPSGTTPGARDIYFQSRSPVTLAGDIIRDAVSVNTIRSITIQTDNVGQTFPGGSVVYEHILTNNGNVVEGSNGGAGTSTLTFALADTLSGIGFTSVTYYDLPSSGTVGALDAGDPVLVSGLAAVKPAGLAPGEQARLFVKVFAPLGAPDGAVNATTITVTTAGVINTIAAPAAQANSDTTSVIRGDLTILKEQAIDTDNDGDKDDETFVTTQLAAKPGQVIFYRITVRNDGSANATGITVNDSVPSNTTYESNLDGAAAITGSGTVNTVTTAPADEASGAFLFTIGTLAPTQSSVITFGVQIDQ